MRTTGNTILITGGSAGMGLEMARLFVANGNKVIITGRDENRLKAAAAQLGNVIAITFDVTKESDVNVLVKRVADDFPELNVLINNAGRAFAYNLSGEAGAYEKATDEMMTNYLSVIRLTEKLLPLLEKQAEAAVVNVSSITVYAPNAYISTYSATKAALHSYTQSLRLALAETSVKVFELMPPMVNTDFSSEIGGEKGIAPSVVAEDVLDAMANNRFEIRTGATEDIYQLSLADPEMAFKAMNGMV
ncbi:SDR family oxidoreductase [Flavobacterium cerinum]|uniref:SDR family NAD(P)-dependent oxidoreductase n=1 Tax=Flavobacterium cerinum TaxID=2502784 RepID=A0A444HEU5_9FLAO|nr:SDR family NAD(P)-dependent oxidoreductase [Flavobacterium cerinum]RWX03498.1 SDR family NAD(P)-dependent oxidoreductase [Flavobacterium cerinum]